MTKIEKNPNEEISEFGAQSEDISVLIRARYPIIYIVSWEEERVSLMLNNLASESEKRLLIWSTTEGL